MPPQTHYIGHAEIRQTYIVSSVGTVAGCYVTDGKIQRACDVRIVRDGIVVHEGHLASLQRFKDSVKEVAQGYECGLSFEKYNDIKVGDIVEALLEDQEHQVAKEERETPTTDSMPPLLRQAIELFDHQGAEPAFLFGLELIICGLEKQLKCESGS